MEMIASQSCPVKVDASQVDGMEGRGFCNTNNPNPNPNLIYIKYIYFILLFIRPRKFPDFSPLLFPHIGAGLFAKEDIPAGTVLALFSGSSYLPGEVEAIESLWGRGAIFEETSCEYLITTHQGGFIDATGSMVCIQPGDLSIVERCTPRVPPSHRQLEAGVAHMANHANADAANVIAWPTFATVKQMKALDGETLAVWPSWYALHADSQEVDESGFYLSSEGMALVAKHHVSSGEEILLDYEYDTNGSLATPSWYH